MAGRTGFERNSGYAMLHVSRLDFPQIIVAFYKHPGWIRTSPRKKKALTDMLEGPFWTRCWGGWIRTNNVDLGWEW